MRERKNVKGEMKDHGGKYKAEKPRWKNKSFKRNRCR